MLLMKKREFLSSMPEGMWALFTMQIVATIGYSVLYSTLVLYMEKRLAFPVSTANSVMGVFIAFNYGLHLLGGLWGGSLLSNRALFSVGMAVQSLGCILLSLADATFFYYGLAAFLTGSGLNVTCLNCMLTQRFTPEDTQRETAFLMNYAGMNVGFFIGFTLSGFYQLTENYSELFVLSSLGNVLALFICLFAWKKLEDIGTVFSRKETIAQRKSIAIGLIFVCLLFVGLSNILQYADQAKKLVLYTGVIMLGVLIYLAKQQPTKIAQDKMLAFAALMIVGTIFFMLYHIAPMGLTVFIDNNVHRGYADWIIPPQWFQNINTLSIVVGGPLLGMVFHHMRQKGIQVNIPAQFTLALLCIGVGFVILPIGIVFANDAGLMNPSWIVASYLLQSLGELLISPIGYAMIGYLAPSSLQGMMMGMWMLTSGIGGALSSYSSNLMTTGVDSLSPLATNSGYSHVFLMLGLFSVGASIVLFVLIPKLRALMPEQHMQGAEEATLVNKRVFVCE